ncbi:MAG: flagellar biosynthetic protein FliR [Rhodocyclales bacterium GWA2_65_20]|nr:MAG: flagellar biosynthetic protein FliR [Rhodocyclales bacterium GWA2_65_20]
MITVTSAQLDAWLAAFIFPLARVLGLIAAAPIFNNAALPERIKLVAGLVITLAIIPALPPMPDVPAGSWAGLAILVQQMLIGIVLGFSQRIVFAAVDVAGQLIGLQMGLSFAVFYDPTNSSQTAVVSNFLGLLGMLIFLALNGHLLMLSLLAQSFTLLPVSSVPFAAKGYAVVLAWATTMFVAGVLLSLPLLAALLIANIAMGVLARVAPQLNLFAVGFPVTIVAGFMVIMISLPYFGAALERLYAQGFTAMTVIMKAGGGG